MKKNYYFPFEVSMMNDERIAALMETYGPGGFGIYLLLLTELSQHPNYSCGINTINRLTRAHNLENETVNDIIHNYKLFEVINHQGEVSIASPYMNQVMDAMEKRRKRCSVAGKKGANKVKRGVHGRFTGDAGTNNNDDDDDTIGNDEKLTEIKSWETHLEEAINDETWLECQAMHSGLGKQFVKYQENIVKMFKFHTITHGRDSQMLSTKDVKFYFANFIRQGTVTNKRIAGQLKKLENQAQKEDPYRFEIIDPKTGKRSYYGYDIPQNAPPRPNDRASWNELEEKWE